MRPIEVDAGRYAWCRSHALWIIGMPTSAFLEDARGAQRAGQDGLLHYAARMIGDACAVALNLAVNYERPIPSPAMRSSWALDRLRGHELRQPCWELIRGVEDAPSERIVERCESLISGVREVIGEAPDILTPEGYFPALGMARSWLKLLDAVDEDSPLPRHWARSN